MTISATSQPLMDEAEQQWERELGEHIEAHLLTLGLADPKQTYLTAREEACIACQEHWTCTRKPCDSATITKVSLMATHSYLSKQSPLGLLYTFGYSMSEASTIIEQLIALGVVIYDIRSSPRSHSYTWRKPYLQRLFGDSYRHVPALGNIHYKDGLPIELADLATGVPQVVQPLQAGKHIAFMCVCREHHLCHRRNAAEEILKHVPGAILLALPSLDKENHAAKEEMRQQEERNGEGWLPCCQLELEW